MANYNLDVKTLAQLMRQAALADLSFSFEWQAQYVLDKLESTNGSHTNLADITSQKIAQLKREEHFGIQDAYAGANPEPFPCSKDYDTDGQEGESYRDDDDDDDTGRYQSGYRIYRNGTIREDFGSDR